jgi:hypothetical protein
MQATGCRLGRTAFDNIRAEPIQFWFYFGSTPPKGRKMPRPDEAEWIAGPEQTPAALRDRAIIELFLAQTFATLACECEISFGATVEHGFASW